MKDSQYSSPVFTLTVEGSIHDALVLMKTNFIKRVVVIKNKKPIGILTERDINRFLEKDQTTRSLSEISVREIMKKNLITMTADQPDFLHQCATRMATFKIGSIIITDEDGNLVGIVTQTDITRAFASMYSGKYKVKDYMSEKTVTCRNTDYLKYALQLLNKNNVSRLIVTDNIGSLKGLITTNTFLQHSDYFKNPNNSARNYFLKDDSSLTVADLAGSEILTVEPGNDLANAANLMIKNSISGIPVVVNGSVSGVVTKFDVVRAFCDVPIHGEVLKRYRLPT